MAKLLVNDPAHPRHAIYREGFYWQEVDMHNPYRNFADRDAWIRGRLDAEAGKELPAVGYDDSTLRPRERT